MKLFLRKFQTEADGEKIRQFLREVYCLNNRHAIGWPVYRWDYWRWHINANFFRFDLSAAVFMWETGDNRLAAILHPYGKGESVLQVHPDFHATDLEVEMLQVAETQFAVTQPDGGQCLTVWAHESDALRQDLLARRGYVRRGQPEYQHRKAMIQPIPHAPVPVGYSILASGDENERDKRCWVSWKAFHPDEPDGNFQGWDWYRNIQRAPLYRRDLDLAAVDSNGELAAVCTLWYDDATQTAAFEPVGTHPDHQHRGLGKALMAEGLRRVSALGATLNTVTSYAKPEENFLAALGFTQSDLTEPWVKEW